MYRLDIVNEARYELRTYGQATTIQFNGYSDESKEGKYILPQQDLFIAIPPNTDPEIVFNATQTNRIKARPEINPIVQRNSDSSLLYVRAPVPQKAAEQSLFAKKGYVWIGDYYCLHLQVHPYSYDDLSNSVTEVKEYRVELRFRFRLPAATNIRPRKEQNSVLNSVYSETVKGKRTDRRISRNDDWIDYTKTYLKIGTAKDAIYRISYSDLNAAGIPLNAVNPKTLRLLCRGKENAIFVQGENDSTFDPGDYIEFIGQRNYGGKYREVAQFGSPYNDYLDRYSDTTIYWLTWGGETGARVDSTLSFDGSAPSAVNYYDELIHSEQDLYYDYSDGGGVVRREMPDIFENETWNEGRISVGTRNFNFVISDLYPLKLARAFVKQQSYSSDINLNAHRAGLSINSNTTVYDSGFINKYEVKVLHADFTSSDLHNGTNSLFIYSYPTANSVNQMIGDWYEVEYPRYLKATNDSLSFSFRSLTNPTPGQLKISGVQSNAISLYKLSSGSQTTRITNYSRSADTVSFFDTIHLNDKYFLIAENRILPPIIYNKKQFVNLRNPQNRADYILITHPQLMQTAQNYISFIGLTYGISTKLVNVFDIYDEFNYGFLAPEPIREFLKATNSLWLPPQPKNVFLVGRAAYDFYGNKTKYFGAPAQPNFVPSYGDPVSDTWFVIWDTTGASIPQMDIGRLPVRSVDEFQSYFEKHKKYIAQSYDEWNKKYLFFSGGNFTDTSQMGRLRSVNDEIVASFVKPPPVGGIAHHFFKTANPVTNFGPYAPSEITSAIEEGAVFISYIGHSGTETWDNSITDPAQLNNTQNRFPLISDFGCSTAKCAEPDVTSFSELFVSGLSGQAIAYIANSSLGFETTAETFPRLFYGTILKDSVHNLGEAHRIAKTKFLAQYGASDLFKLFSLTNTLIGDPIISLPIPKKPNLVITAHSIEPLPSNVNDLSDSLLVKFSYFNWGKVPADSFGLRLTDHYNGIDIYQSTLRRKVPAFADTITSHIPIKNRTGAHALRIELDYLQSIDEITKADNSFTLEFNVASTAVRAMSAYPVQNQIQKEIRYLNPSLNAGTSNVIIELSKKDDFSNSVLTTIQIDTFYTRFPIDTSYKGSRIWLRSRMEGSSSFGVAQSYYVGNGGKYLLIDGTSFSTAAYSKLKYSANNVALDTSIVTFSAISAGVNGGNTAVISKNNQNYIPENTLKGHHVCVFDGATFQFIEYRRFNIFDDGLPATQNYINFLDSLNNNSLVVIAISNEGSGNLTNELKARIKALGSKYIDSVGFTNAWAIIGRKGSAPGSVPEKYSSAFDARVQIDTSIIVPNSSGRLVTSVIGPATQWRSADLLYALPGTSEIKFRPLGIKKNGSVDTLNYLSVFGTSADISFIDATIYPKIQILADYNAASDGTSPSLSQVGVNYVGVPELGTNYQVVQTNKIEAATNRLSKRSAISSTDSILQGELLGVKARVYNVGESKAESVKVKANVAWPNNDVEELGTLTIDSIPPLSYREVSFTYNSSAGFGNRTFQLYIDPENKIQELYKDNNYYPIPFVVLRDSLRPQLVDVFFDGNHIQNGDYVSASPTIDINVRDDGALPILDTATVSISLDEKRVYYNLNTALSLVPGSTTKEMTVRFRPALDKGEHQLGLSVKDRSGNFFDSTEHVITFSVDPQLKVEELFNYPNPFATQTYFAFKLTQVPEELQIKIYTVAGRLIKAIKLSSAELVFGFNKIYWDGRDGDGDDIANGVYLYRLIAKGANQQIALTQKLVKMR
jgi:hypothetical protein